jgi:hypothetical protein
LAALATLEDSQLLSALPAVLDRLIEQVRVDLGRLPE